MLGVEPRALDMLGNCFILEPQPAPALLLFVFERGSLQLYMGWYQTCGSSASTSGSWDYRYAPSLPTWKKRRITLSDIPEPRKPFRILVNYFKSIKWPNDYLLKAFVTRFIQYLLLLGDCPPLSIIKSQKAMAFSYC